ncbi:hypothetical protein OG994_18540 [Micromonospora globbae]|jgi:hypothetical protein|uniref:DUF3558 domain-containing protein n=2 Tax=Micromonospora globbae TaxID=1894969 RepID=A0A420F2V6_9ACTN|nr:hypothetical protein [Micromonospora globbae]RKF27281.1 hypothetical protein D7I43_12495 [Micromonospora globbae]WTF89016.1 hypothetical protein OH732_07990 [Micromonospora globbae]
MIVPALVLAALVLGGCDSTDTTADPGTDVDAPLDGGDLAGGDDAPPPPCPFTAEQVGDLVGQPMVDKGSCSFGDGNGVALFTITTASRTAGEMTYDYKRQQAEQIYQKVTDIDQGGKGYIAAKDIEGELYVIADAGSFTVTLSSFQRLGAPDAYEQTLRRVLDALPLT